MGGVKFVPFKIHAGFVETVGDFLASFQWHMRILPAPDKAFTRQTRALAAMTRAYQRALALGVRCRVLKSQYTTPKRR